MLISRPTKYALTFLAVMIRAARMQRGMFAAKLAERIGVSRGAVQRLKAAQAGTAIGTAYEAATILRIRLFDVSTDGLTALLMQKQELKALLPKRAYIATQSEADNDF